MPLSLSWYEIGLRRGLTVAVGILIGYNRSQHGKAAGMRTTVTTAATLWLVTVIGLCLGGGQLALGLAGISPSRPASHPSNGRRAPERTQAYCPSP